MVIAPWMLLKEVKGSGLPYFTEGMISMKPVSPCTYCLCRLTDQS
jgi:hypothetical protein